MAGDGKHDVIEKVIESVHDIPGEMLVLDTVDDVSRWNDAAVGGAASPIRSEAELVREGAAAGRWRPSGTVRERIGFAVPENKRNWDAYDRVQFWCYPSKHNYAAIHPWVDDGNGSHRAPLKIDWVGWRLVTVEKRRFKGKVDWSDIRAFGLEERTYSGQTSRLCPRADTDLVIDSVVLTKKILEGSLQNESGAQQGPITYVARVRNLSGETRGCRLTFDQARHGSPTDEIAVTIEPAEMEIEPGKEAIARITFDVPAQLMADPKRLRHLAISVHGTLEGHPMPQFELTVPCRRLYFDTLRLGHPRLLVTAERMARVKQPIGEDERARTMWQGVLADADAIVSEPVRQPKDTRTILTPLWPLAFAYLMTGDLKYARKAQEYVKVGLRLRSFRNTQSRKYGERQTDLSTGHYTMDLAVAYDWLYDFWTPRERTAIARQLVRRGIEPHYLDCKVRYAWDHDYVSNWSAVATGGVGVGALALLGDIPDASRWAEMATDRIERTAEAQGLDGGSYEGSTYWTYLMNFMDTFADALRVATAGKLNLLRQQPFWRRTSYFWLSCVLPEGELVSFRDSHYYGNLTGPIESPRVPNHFLLMAAEFGDGYLQRYALNARGGAQGLLWYDPAVAPIAEERRPLAQLSRGPKLALLRSANEANAVFLALRAGSNDEDHGHFDILNFIVSGYGYQLAADYGPGRYSAPSYFGPGRHKTRRAATFGHNCILVNGQGQTWGPGVEGRIVRFFTSRVVDYVCADGSTAYPSRLLDTWKRHVLFVMPHYFVLWDEMASPKPVGYEWRMMTWSEDRDPPSLTEHGAVTTVCAYERQPDKAAQLKLAHASWPIAFETAVGKFPYDPEVDPDGSDAARNYYVRTSPAEKTARWTLLTMLFPADVNEREGRGDFTPVQAVGAIGARIGDAKDPKGPDTILVSVGDGEAKAGDLRLRGKAALVSGRDDTTRYALVCGERLVRGGTTLVSATAPIIASAAIRGAECAITVQARLGAEVTLHTGDAETAVISTDDHTVELRPVGGTVTVRIPQSGIDDFLRDQSRVIGEQSYE